jgi:hypothetical protein
MSDERSQRKRERRTGVIFLVLIAATNVIVWMEPVARARVSGDVAASSEIRVGLASCFLAACLALAAWSFGRRYPSAEPPGSKARLQGLRFSLLSAILNLAFVGVILILAPALTGPISELPMIAAAWYLILLPVQVAAAYWMGRGSRGVGRRGTAAVTVGGP